MATPSPVIPADFKNVISDPTASLCGNFVNTLLKLPVLIYKYFAYWLDADGNINPAALRQIHRPGDLILSAAPLAPDATRLLCDGSEVSQTTYAALYAALGDIYGTAGPGNFKLPDYRARFPVGVGSFPSGDSVALTVPGGEEKHTLLGTEVGEHEHFIANTDAVPKSPSGGATPSSLGANYLIRETSDTHSSDYILDGNATVATVGRTSTNQAQANVAPHKTVPPYLPAFIYCAT